MSHGGLRAQQDDAIAMLMNEMGQQQGYDDNGDNDDDDNDDYDNGDDNGNHNYAERRERLLPELSDYPNNSHCAGNKAIWNEYVQPEHDFYGDNSSSSSNSSSSPNTSTIPLVALATNPQVEIIRRRCYEKFKKETQEGLQRILFEKNVSAHTVDWKNLKLPTVPAILEKWHMDAKLQEREVILSRLQTKSSSKNKHDHDGNNALVLMDSTTSRICQRTAKQLQHPNRLERIFYDPILVSKDAPSLFRNSFKSEVVKACPNGVEPPKDMFRRIKQIAKMLYKVTCQTLESYPLQLQQAVKLQSNAANISSKKNKRRGHHAKFKIQVTTNEETNQVQLLYTGISYRIHMAYYEKLQRLYDRSPNELYDNNNNNNNDDDNDMENTNDEPYKAKFHAALYCLLCRYDMLQGAGLQAGVPGTVMDALLIEFDCQMECFASPLNCRYQTYASAFDLDRLFGSVGSFFDLDFTSSGGGGGGCYQANPPFCEDLIGKMNATMQKVLRSTSQNKKKDDDNDDDDSNANNIIPLMFIVFVPAWKKNSTSYQQLLENEFLTKHLLLDQGKHWYTEGTQHRRKQSFRVASFDTSIFFFQNDAAKQKWPVTKERLERLKTAFCQDPGTMDKTLSTATTTTIVKKKTKTTTAPTVDDVVEATTAKRSVAPTKIDGQVIAATEQVQKGSTSNRDEKMQQSKKIDNKRKHKKTKDTADKKRKFLGGDESTAQLDLLQSLGLATSEPKAIDKTTAKNKKPKKKGKHRKKTETIII